jgi:hypothetical protein
MERRTARHAGQGQRPAVYRIADGRIAGAWFFPDGFDPDALTKVFSFEAC